ncbi:dnaJ homolog subfamily B member 14-like [Phoenix dactylifera]|uniref:DnaJ homolog subfamily B member 14-like n=1 Tax=Phoenix dactylifera TaxID=42345 RepID=A0A8B7C1M1_PHODC|nr:dnaJ homolog subfamily B member 14-like [Phoenix dactylifera]
MDKERAEKAMREAEEKFQSNDIEGAKRMVLRARKLFPSARGLPQMLAAFNVHIAAASKDAKGRTNWYAVLDVDPSDDIKTIKKQYKKLCLLIHPDKNRSSAAEGAFKLVCQAWEAITGNASSSEKASTGTGGSPSDSGAGDQHSSTSGARSSSRPSSIQSDPKSTRSSSARSDHKTTWSSSSRSDPKTNWSSSSRWNPDKSSSKAEVACPKCSRNCKSLDSGDLIIRCSYCNLFAVRGRQDSSVFLTMDEHGPGILGL